MVDFGRVELVLKANAELRNGKHFLNLLSLQEHGNGFMFQLYIKVSC